MAERSVSAVAGYRWVINMDGFERRYCATGHETYLLAGNRIGRIARRMIAVNLMDSTIRHTDLHRRTLLLASVAALAGCTAASTRRGVETLVPMLDAAAFIAADGARLPYRAWLPAGPPRAIVLALHGFNDCRDAWELPGPEFADAGIALYASDQRGFGAAPGRGLWPGADALADDAAELIELLRTRHPGLPIIAMGESMGGAVLMHMATRGGAPQNITYVMLAPAVWGRARMNMAMRASLAVARRLVPGMLLGGPPSRLVRILPSDNRDALIRLANNPLHIRLTRTDTTAGLVDLMDIALAAAPRFRAPALFLYGANDDLVPKPATRATWRSLPDGLAQRAYYHRGYHLLLRDLSRAIPTRDIISWIQNPDRPLPSGAQHAASAWMAGA